MTTRYSLRLGFVAALLLTIVLIFATACGDSETTDTLPAGSSGNAVVDGLVDTPMLLTADGLEAMDTVDTTVDHPKLGLTDYHGVLLSTVFTAAGMQSDATALIMTAADGYMAEVALSDIEACPEAMITMDDDGVLGVVIPGMESKTWVKDVISLDLR